MFSHRSFFASREASSSIWTWVERFGRFFHVQFWWKSLKKLVFSLDKMKNFPGPARRSPGPARYLIGREQLQANHCNSTKTLLFLVFIKNAFNLRPYQRMVHHSVHFWIQARKKKNLADILCCSPSPRAEKYRIQPNGSCGMAEYQPETPPSGLTALGRHRPHRG